MHATPEDDHATHHHDVNSDIILSHKCCYNRNRNIYNYKLNNIQVEILIVLTEI